MFAYKLCDENNVIPSLNLQESLGEGADGEVFSISKKEVVKLHVLYENSIFCENKNIDIVFNEIIKSFEIIKNTKPKHIVKIFDYKFLGKFQKKLTYNKQNYILFYSIMEKLNKLTDDEKRVFHTVISLKENFYQKTLNELNGYLLFSVEKVKLFLNQIKKSKINHLDFGTQNIMKDDFGNFKLIDLDRLEILQG